jgi:ubiquinone biosynthesis protein
MRIDLSRAAGRRPYSGRSMPASARTFETPGSGRLRRYRDLAALMFRLARDEAVRPGRHPAPSPHGPGDDQAQRGQALARELEAMGPTFVKLGQLLSTHLELPPAYAAALSRLRDDCRPEPFAQVRETAEQELGCSLGHAFESFEEHPLAAASLGQVHRAVLRSGRVVAVKVQRRGVRQEITADFQALDRIARWIDGHTEAGRRYEFERIMHESRQLLLSELDYRAEARHMRTLRTHLAEAGFGRLMVPQPVDDYTTPRILTMDFIPGTSIGSLGPLSRLEVPGALLADELLGAYLHQILVTGLVHADPHPGNVFLTDDGRLALLDLGQVTELDPSTRQELMEMMLAVSEGRGDEAASVAIRIGRPREGFNARAFRGRISQIVAQHRDAELDAIAFGDSMMAIGRACADSALRIPVEVNMIGKICGNLGAVCRVLDPRMRPNQTLRNRLASLVGRQLWQSTSPGSLLATGLELRRLVQKLPERANHILDMLADNQLRIRMDVLDERRLMAGFQKIANRITLGLVLASMIVAGAMMMRVPTQWTVLGYPALPMLMISFAGLAGAAMVLEILLRDERQPPSPPGRDL